MKRLKAKVLVTQNVKKTKLMDEALKLVEMSKIVTPYTFSNLYKPTTLTLHYP